MTGEDPGGGKTEKEDREERGKVKKEAAGEQNMTEEGGNKEDEKEAGGEKEQQKEDKKTRPVIIGCFDCNGKCNLTGWRKASAKLKTRSMQELQALATQRAIPDSSRTAQDALISALMETEVLVELSFPRPPSWKEFDAASKKKLGKHVRLLECWAGFRMADLAMITTDTHAYTCTCTYTYTSPFFF